MISECHYCAPESCTVGYGYCHCGCGETTNVAPVSRKKKNQVKGKPLKVVRHHQVRVSLSAGKDENSCLYCEGGCSVGYGYCHCGCGEKTNLATYGSRWHTHQRGKPVRFVVGHARRKPVVLIEGKQAKECVGCFQLLFLSEFGFNLGGAQGRAARCFPCSAIQSREAYQRRGRDPEEARKRRKRAIKTLGYQITLEEVEELERKQNGVCAICLRPEIRARKSDGYVYSLAIDHCHDTGKVRGLLCSKCNTALGKLDTVDLLQAAINYLKEASYDKY